jgi:hypothetical protein
MLGATNTAPMATMTITTINSIKVIPFLFIPSSPCY